MKIKYCGVSALMDERRKLLTFDIFGSDDEGDFSEEQAVPFKWDVCGGCDGSGVTTRHIECDGGGFTSGEWAEACDGDPDFAEDYLTGKYDRDCPECCGKRVVPVIDMEESDSRWAPITELIDGERAYRAERAAERRMGA